ncbi:sulfur carrier protein ThiS [Bacillus solimangrovi]|uniref:Thiamine biosynthesis protein ThiS n=1 Tax=Bacillus solimangrovi TaxID=1305675 RepID=A0A1E5LFV8_9BACI|nr:sulfur carrier protein ThiS [Bacillus solimangrovi]OEH92954.1 thiamine biosynthesis protein ThiS [Bacillus solimangrovi]
MTIIVNGENINIPESVNTLQDLVHHYNLENKIIVIEQNKEIISQNNYHQQILKNNDVIEIVNFVGGG